MKKNFRLQILIPFLVGKKNMKFMRAVLASEAKPQISKIAKFRKYREISEFLNIEPKIYVPYG